MVSKTETIYFPLRVLGAVSGFFAALLIVSVSLEGLQLAIKNKLRVYISFLAVSSIFLWPPFLSVSLSFMTDSLAVLFGCLGILALGRFLDSSTWLNFLLAAISTWVGVAQRQFLFLLPISVFLIFVLSTKRKSQLKSVELLKNKNHLKMFIQLGVFLISLPVIHVWWAQISPLKSPPLELLGDFKCLQRPYEYLLCLGFPFFPLVLLPEVPSHELPIKHQRIFRKTFLFCTFLTGVLLMFGLGFPFFNNLLSNYGFFGLNEVLLGSREIVITYPIRVVLTVFGLLGARRIILGLIIVFGDSKISNAVRVLLCFSGFYFGMLVVRNGHLDRYLILLLPGSLYLFLRSVCSDGFNRKRIVGCILLVAVNFIFSTTLVSDYFRWNEGRWKLIGLALDHYKVLPRDLNGGYEFTGAIEKEPWSWSNPNTFTHVVSFSPLPGFREIDKVAYRSYWGQKNKLMYLLKRIESTEK